MDTVVQIAQGKIRGRIAQDYQGGKYYSFQGIPYAKPPIGDLRFKIAQPLEPWEGIKDCTAEGSECLSRDFFDKHRIVGSEDCLHLNVYVPQTTNETSLKKPRPVMFWVHGGGFTMGSSKTDIYGPDYLMTADVILVTTNYRLGIFGFLSLEDSSLGVPGNNAFKDMVMALKWVQENIHAFNGDPNNVTIFGESAGGAATHLLVLSPMCKGLFHRAIIQSGCALNPWPYGTRCAKLIAKQMGFMSDDEKEILAQLKSVSAKEILEAQLKTYDGLEADVVRDHGLVIEKPSSEPAFLTEHPIDIIKQGKQNKVPIMIGYTSKEGMLTALWYKDHPTDEFKMITNFETKIPHHFKIAKGTQLSKKIADKIQQFYYKGMKPSMDLMDTFYDLESDRFFIRGINMTIKHHIKSAPEVPIYFYRFSVDRELNFVKKLANITSPGASHCDELGYLFKTRLIPELKLGSIEELLVRRMVRLWSNFARAGNPNPITEDTLIDVQWRAVKPDRLYFLDIGESLSEGVDPESERMAFWDEISNLAPAAKDM